MKTVSEKQKRLVIIGATGMVGGDVLRYALDQSAVGHVTAIGRRTLGNSHPKLREIVHQDFAGYHVIVPYLRGYGTTRFCQRSVKTSHEGSNENQPL
jgi:uncharacterized protein YbjT (DUF2867 family)